MTQKEAPPLPRPRQAVVLCGGLATRMYPLTRALPKLLLPVGGRPFGHFLLERLAGFGYDEAVLCIGHLGELIRESVGDGASFGLRVHYADEGEQRLGTAGALRRAAQLLRPTFLVTYGDSYLPFDYASPLDDLDAHPEARGTMAVFRNEGRWDDSNCEIAGSLVVRYEKRRADELTDPRLDHIDYGAIALRREVVHALAEGPSDLADVLRDLARAGSLRSHLVKNRFYEIGSEAGYRELEALLGAAREDVR